MSDCIEWTGYCQASGHGQRRYRGKTRLAHRVAWFETYGYWPNICRHKCDNPPCVNVDHLEDGTRGDNNRDTRERGRTNWATGERNATARFTWSQVREIRALYAAGVGQREIGRRYNASHTTIGPIVRGESWKEPQA